MNEKRLGEINERLEVLKGEIEGADEARFNEIEAEVTSLQSEKDVLERKMNLAGSIKKEDKKMDSETVSRAQKFAETGQTSISAEEVRATLISGGTIATPAGVSGINDKTVESSIVDMVNIVDCSGMGSNQVAYVASDSSASDQTEGSAPTNSDPTYGYVTISPTTEIVVSQISNQVKKQSPLQYETKTKQIGMRALRKKAANKIVTKLKASALADSVNAELDSNSKGKLTETTIADLVFAYGGDEEAGGAGVLFLNKADLRALGKVRGTNEKKPVYEVIPDSNPNTGVIKDGGIAVRYCICSSLTACSGTAQTSTDVLTMYYGDPKNIELDLFGDYEIKTSEDFAFTSNMDTVRGTVDMGTDLVVNHGGVFLKIAKSVSP